MIEVEGLTKQYGPIAAIKNLNFKVEQGDVMGFLGPNGAGKTTTMRILTGYMPATEGTAKVAGHDVFDEPQEVKKRIGYLPERPPLYNYMVVEDYLLHVSELKGIPRASRQDAIEKALKRCSLDDVRGRLIGHLSKGYQQRIGIAQAIIHDPQVLILDEPTIGLDPRQIVEIREMIRGFAGAHTIVLSTHILSEVSQICNKVIIINHGEIVAADTVDGLRQQISEADWVRVKVGGERQKVLDAIRAVPGVEKVEAEANIEDVFLKLIEANEAKRAE